MERAELKALVRAMGCAEERGETVLLCDPRWGAAERAPVRALAMTGTAVDDGWLGVPTGGTSGGLKFARHDERTLGAAAAGFVAHFGVERVNAVDVLPPFHVSGLMARVRCAVTGGTHVAWDWRRLEAGERPVVARARGDWMISLVPTQLQRLLASEAAVAWLRGFRVIFLGGGPAWGALTDAAAKAELPVALSYGMTETAAMVTALKPDEFLAGERSAGSPLPHARVTVDAAGLIGVEGASLFLGYMPERRAQRFLVTEDLGEFDARGRLRVLGRRDAVIITGGEKVNPLEVEAALRATGEFADVAVVGVPDAEWGEAVVACYPAGGVAPDKVKIEHVINRHLSAYKRPKRYVAVADWPRNAQGKVNRVLLRLRAAEDVAGVEKRLPRPVK